MWLPGSEYKKGFSLLAKVIKRKVSQRVWLSTKAGSLTNWIWYSSFFLPQCTFVVEIADKNIEGAAKVWNWVLSPTFFQWRQRQKLTIKWMCPSGSRRENEGTKQPELSISRGDRAGFDLRDVLKESTSLLSLYAFHLFTTKVLLEGGEKELSN